MRSDMFAALVIASALICGCGGGSNAGTGGGGGGGGTTPAVAPTVATAPAQNNAVIVSLSASTNGSKIYFTLDGSTPTLTSQVYQAPFLVASNMTVNAIAVASGYTNSPVTTKAFSPGIASGTLVWSDEFANTGTTNILPDAKTWTYDTGFQCCGNNELETYCAAGSTSAPCDPNNPNAFIDTTGILHIEGRQPSGTAFTSARLKSQGQVSFMYGRIEARMKIPESQGMWPAFWLLGNNIVTESWPACGEIDVMEHINGSNPENKGYDWIAGSTHAGVNSASELNNSSQFTAAGFSAAAWHTYGMIWTKGQIQFYVDDPTKIYATSTPSTLGSPWPFDSGPQFIILNLAIGGSWPGNPDSTTVFPGDMQVDYVRVYSN